MTMFCSCLDPAWHRPESYVTARRSKTLRLAPLPASPSHPISSPISFQRCPKMSKVWYQLVPLISVPRFAPMLELLPWNPDNSQNPATKSTVWLEANSKSSMQRKDSRFLDARLEVAAIDVHALSFWQTQHRRWWEGGAAVLPKLHEPPFHNINWFISSDNGSTTLQSSWIQKRFSHVPTDFIFNSKILKKKKAELHTHGLTLFLLKRPSEMMMLIWPWCVFFDPKKTPFVNSSLHEAWAEGTCWTWSTAPHTKQGRGSALSKKIKGIYNYIVLDFLDVYTINIHINVHHINTAGPIFWLSTVCQYVNPPRKKNTITLTL